MVRQDDITLRREMNNNTDNSRRALILAYLRAIESYRPERERLFDDRFSRDLMPLSSKISLLPGFRHAIVAMMEANVPGLIGDLYCRTRYIDDALDNALRDGVQRVVILGAGFDARAYRISGIEQTHVFELDLPEPQRLKQTLVAQILGELPPHVTYVPIDFDRQDLGSTLAAEGFQSGLRTFFICEGVTQYITEEAVDRIFRTIYVAAAKGSEVVFTYIQQGIIDGTARLYVDRKMMSAVNESGTPWIFGLASSRLAEYLLQRGFELVEDVGAADFQARYLKPRGRELYIYKGERVALARIAGKEIEA